MSTGHHDTARYHKTPCDHMLAKRRWAICDAACDTYKRSKYQSAQCGHVSHAGIWSDVDGHALAQAQGFGKTFQ